MDPSSIFYAPSEMDSQQIRFSSSSEINTSGGVFAEPLINKRRACSNGFPNQLLLDTTVTQYSWAPVSNNIACSSGFGGSNTMAAMSFNSVNNTSLQFVDSQQQKQMLSRSLESLALITAPSTSDSLFMVGGTELITIMTNDTLQHRDDSRINYSFDYNDSGMFNGSAYSTTGTTNTESFSSAGDSFMSTQHSQIDDYEPANPTQGRLSADDHHPQQFDSVFNEIIDGMQQCRPFQQDFEMDEC